ncbi:MAG: HAMP domain-containing histidine kinase [Bacteriovoracaceae bacterium]|nr:HAMP domain-containing histidine kinase [Bacteriovoracaceae bacterium]
MKISWTAAEENQYTSLIDKQMRHGCLIISLLCFSLFPVCFFLDYYTQREYLEELVRLRVLIVPFYGVMVLYVWKFYQTLRPLLVSVFMLGCASLAITLMCLVMGGFNSPYYSGVGLVVLGGLLVCPLGAKKMGLLVIFLLSIYTFGCLTRYQPDQLDDLINNLYTLAMMGIIGVSSSYLSEKMRQDSFTNFLEAQRAQEELRVSKDMLQFELHSEQTNVASLVKEITQRKNELESALVVAEEARKKAQDALNIRQEFISLASHELNTPITSLQLQTQLLLKKLQNDQSSNGAVISKTLQVYESQVKRIGRTVKDMLDISRMEKGNIELLRSEVELEQLVNEMLLLVQGLGASEILFKSAGPVRGQWDNFRLEQVILNLLTNAIKFGQEKPIEIILRQNGNWAEIIVADQGIGIPHDEQERIFNRFERGVSMYQYSGLGLGLYLTKSVVTAHEGSIHVESAPGEGSRFTVKLPL